MQAYYQPIIEITDRFCVAYLDNDYLLLAQYATAMLCRKRPSPLISGRANTWAAGILHALGTNNFLFDKNSRPYISYTNFAEILNLSKSTIRTKSKQIRDLIEIHRFDHHWCLPSQLKHNSQAWMIMFNGFIVDARKLAPEIQEAAYKKGLIPYVYASQP